MAGVILLEQFGEVISVDDATAVVKVRRHSACRECGRCGLGITGGEAIDPVVEVNNPIGARVGQVVKITMDTKKMLLVSFVVYLVPVLSLILGIILGQFMIDSLELAAEGRTGEIASIVLGIFLMVVTFVFIRRWDKKVGSSARFKPVAVSIVETKE